jgi:hypothetical protein
MCLAAASELCQSIRRYIITAAVDAANSHRRQDMELRAVDLGARRSKANEQRSASFIQSTVTLMQKICSVVMDL